MAKLKLFHTKKSHFFASSVPLCLLTRHSKGSLLFAVGHSQLCSAQLLYTHAIRISLQAY